jgi:large subunit ribosomal protein L13
MIVDAKEMVVGRLASKLAKALINDEKVTIINAENAVMIGTKNSILRKYRARVNAAVKSNPHYGPKYDRIPSKMLRKMIKGMLSNKKRTNERQLTNLTIYNNVPSELIGSEMTIIEEAKFNNRNDAMTLGEIAKLLGGKW